MSTYYTKFVVTGGILSFHYLTNSFPIRKFGFLPQINQFKKNLTHFCLSSNVRYYFCVACRQLQNNRQPTFGSNMKSVIEKLLDFFCLFKINWQCSQRVLINENRYVKHNNLYCVRVVAKGMVTTDATILVTTGCRDHTDATICSASWGYRFNLNVFLLTETL